MPPEADSRDAYSVEPRALGFGRLFDVLRDAVVVADDQGRIRLWNEAAQTMFGYAFDEVVGRPVDLLVPEAYRSRHGEAFARWRETGHGALIESGLAAELPALRQDGSTFWVELTLAPMEHEGRRYALALLRDVTERVRLREEIEARNARLADANESLESFAHIVGHDLKEPVRALGAYLEALDEDHGAALPDEAREMVERGRLAVTRLQAMIGGLLDLSRVARMGPPDLERVDVAEALRAPECAGRFETLLAARGASLDVEGRGAVLAASSLLCQALGNLVLNAVAHNPHAKPRVRVRIEPDGARVRVHVEDDGPGYPPALLMGRRVARKGFGLDIARRSAERLGGSLELSRSEDLGGAKATLTLRAARPADAAPR